MTSPLNVQPLLNAILKSYALPWNGGHGISHWARVLENGRRLAPQTGANADVVTLFDGRAAFRVVPALVKEEWGVDLTDESLRRLAKDWN